jgi:cell division protein FtsB
MAAGVIGNLETLEQPSKGEGSDDADPCEHRAHLQVLRQRRVQPEDRENQDLRDHRDAVARDCRCLWAQLFSLALLVGARQSQS